MDNNKTKDNSDIANEFIAQWQENFANMMQGSEINNSFETALNQMQQFYNNAYGQNQSAASAAFSNAFGNGEHDPKRAELERRIDELEERIRQLENAAD